MWAGVIRCRGLTWAYLVVIMVSPVQVDFVGHLLNPKFSRGLPVGEAARLAAPLRDQRVQLTGGSETGRAASLERERAERARKRVEQGGASMSQPHGPLKPSTPSTLSTLDDCNILPDE